MSNLERLPVRTVAEILKSKGHQHPVIELSDTARSAEDAAKSLGVAVGAIVKTLLFIVVTDEKQTPIVALISGDGM
jgi:prolyl-tRNA editing enzyme YbaK/EbsC (Cys-tRNA(Pro) deacylase)